jgi:hypothetical protein
MAALKFKVKIGEESKIELPELRRFEGKRFTFRHESCLII